MFKEKEKTILVVDDSNVIRQSLKSFFQEYDFNVITCHDGLEGIKQAAEVKPDLIILDLMMPNLDGIKMLKVLKVIDGLNNIPVIVISGNTNRTNVLAVLESGAERVLTKPVQRELLVKAVKEVLGVEVLTRSAPKEVEYISNEGKSEIKTKLQKFFLNNFPIKRKAILESLTDKNIDLLKTITHELKGEGGTIGVNKLTELCAVIEIDLSSAKIDWLLIKTKCDKLFSIVNDLENSLN